MSPTCTPGPPIFPSSISTSSKHLITTLTATISPTNLHLTTDLTHLTTSFKTRYFRSKTGREASIWVYNRLRSIVRNKGGGGYINASVNLFKHSWIQPSVIARIEGSSNTTIILSSHIDSLNLQLPLFLPAPGANDDASGVAALISIFQIIVSSTNPINFKNTLEFHFYSAEEAGFLGSADVFDNYNKMYRDIHSVLQFDMIGRITPAVAGATDNDNKGGGNGIKRKGEIGIVNDFLDEGFKKYIELIAGEYTDINTVDTFCGYACSDHASAIRYGYPGGLLTSGKLEDVLRGADDYSHTSSDTIDRLDLSLITEFVKFGVAWGVALGTADDIINVDRGLGLEEGKRGYLCDNGYPDGWMGGVRRFSAARAADPLGFGLWILVLLVMLGLARPWEELPIVMKMGRMVRRWVRRGYRVLVRREEPD
ncbi:Leucine aminopeptidase 1 [Arthrobotrys conoides]|uniref:Peptide hydrolase n=1 Tax=Arthrobotrys conoides TaxID=74498 RepID=A0AAN8PDZ9_9PEZI